MGVPTEQRFPRSSAVGRYWLARCEGFRARSGAREVGTIEQVRTSGEGDAYSLVIKGHGRRVSIPADRVLEVDPWTETIVLAPSRRLRKQLSRSAVAATKVSGITARAAHVAARGADRYAPIVLERARLAGGAAGRGSVHAARWSAPHARRGGLLAGRVAAKAAAGLAALSVLVVSMVADALTWLRPRLRDVVRAGARRGQSAVSRAVSRSTSARRPV